MVEPFVAVRWSARHAQTTAVAACAVAVAGTQAVMGSVGFGAFVNTDPPGETTWRRIGVPTVGSVPLVVYPPSRLGVIACSVAATPLGVATWLSWDAAHPSGLVVLAVLDGVRSEAHALGHEIA